MSVGGGKVLILCRKCKTKMFDNKNIDDGFKLIALRGSLAVWICPHQKAYCESKKISWERIK